MGPVRHILAIVALSLVIVAGCFAAGYLLMLPDTSAPPMLPPSPAAAPPTTGARPTVAAPRLVIKSALYGDLPDGQAADVTAKVAAAVADNTLTIAATNGNFGDPAEGIRKKLRVEYTLDGVSYTRTVSENAIFSITAAPPRLNITKAVYGDLPDGARVDVTRRLVDALDGDTLTIAATNDNFGDPAPGIEKTLRVEYTLDGKPLSKSVSESETLTIAAE